MPYLLTNLSDSERPDSSYVRADYAPQPGEAVLADSEYERKTTWVWNAATLTLREPTDADHLRWAKRDAERHLEAQAVAEMQNILPVYCAVAAISRNAADPRLTDIKAADDKLTTKQKEIQDAPTLTDVNRVTWEG